MAHTIIKLLTGYEGNMWFVGPENRNVALGLWSLPWSAKISNKSYVNLDKVSLKKMKYPPVYIPYIHFFCVCHKICRNGENMCQSFFELWKA